ncbi:response regulator containing a CheY-like receiver domain and an HTH DNA-binding domain [Microbacterium testaceum StLB037]|uniref:Response regulator containing a CheY-like receiver domain and an HTH DNA-binding domain n=1 Tax=Microbacterium testaceum (strain StLB037) TaxID=979556 RepID=E8NFG2_MICTS|nr:helix-turn-helix transcriptional regulator [Microbacterium testaceum]BAJ75235.1 response regulator containing a CheY-like receiver domain and an HTH DNA-binding domain [Microbacterium testaceum StLB037]
MSAHFLGGENTLKIAGRAADPEGIARHLAAGTPVVLVGPVGVGKTVTMSRVAHALARRDVPTQLVRGVDLPPDTGSPAMEDLPAPGTTLLVDDAHALDERSAATLLQAVCLHRVTACIAVETPLFSRPASDAWTHSLLELGSRGFAVRIDIEPLEETKASVFLRECGADALDDVTTDALVWMANGSRALLYEFAEVANDAARRGRDPLAALRHAPVWTRLGDAVHKNLSTLELEHLTTLVTLGRFSGLASTHAARIRPFHEIKELRAHGYVFQDDSDAGALWANPVLAAEAARVLGDDRVRAIVDTAVTRMLDADGRWWSPPIATVVAESLLRGDPLPVPTADDLRRRALLDAARHANDQGRFATAEAFASTGIAGEPDDVALRLELAYARVSAGDPRAQSEVPPVVAADADRHRAQQIATAWEMRGFFAATRDLHAALDRGRPEDAEPDSSAARVDALAFALQWPLARDHAQQSSRTSCGYWRVWAWLREAYARAQLGDAEGTNRLLTRVQEFVYESGIAGLNTAERLWALTVSLVTHLMLGSDAPVLHARIADERRRAVREGDDRALGCAGLAASLSAAVAGESDAALRNLEAARARFHPIRKDMAVAGVKLLIAQFIAARGRVPEARRIVDRVSSLWADGPLSLRHDYVAARSMIDALDERYDDAAHAAQLALRLTAERPAPMLRLRDLHRAVTLGVAERDALDEIGRLLSGTTASVRRMWDDPPTPLVTGRRHTELRAALLRTFVPRSPSSPTESTPAPTAAAMVDSISLTRREREIAGLIAAGLSNRDIAARLFLSVRTVESHVYQARAKLGAESRRELGRRVAAASQPGSAPLP